VAVAINTSSCPDTTVIVMFLDMLELLSVVLGAEVSLSKDLKCFSSAYLSAV
jgi:hypothetical protein